MDRKEIVKAIGDHFGVKARYMGAPSFAYQIETKAETFIIDREGKITTSEGKLVELHALLNGEVEADTSETTAAGTTESEVAIPMDGHTGGSLKNLVNMIYSKQLLIMKALEFEKVIVSEECIRSVNEGKLATVDDFKAAIGQIDCPGLEFLFEEKRIKFNYTGRHATSEKLKALDTLVSLLNQQAKKLKYASAKVKETDNEKFTFRVWLIRLGMIGDEYKETRKILMQNLTGNSAFRYGKPEKSGSVGE